MKLGLMQHSHTEVRFIKLCQLSNTSYV